MSDNRKHYIDLAEAKKQIKRINGILDQPLLLVGGIAVNQYIIQRRSEDIDLVCDDDTAKRIIQELYPSDTWKTTDVNKDDYRPAYRIENKYNKKYPIIKFGPKLIERGMYEHISEEDMLKGCKCFRNHNEKLKNIIVPSIEFLCYMKIVSFLGRDIQKGVDKIKKDLQDIEDLCNDERFVIDDFLYLVKKNKIDRIIKNEFPKRLALLKDSQESFRKCTFGYITGLFQNCIEFCEETNEQTISNDTEELTEKRINDPSHNRFLVAFDLDGTLIKGIRHSWTLIWNELGFEHDFQIKRKQSFMNGEISYLEWVELDTQELKKQKFCKEHIRKIVSEKKNCSLTKNLEKAIKTLKANGGIIAIISGGIDAVLNELLPNANELFDDIFINRFIFGEDGLFESISATEYDWDDTKRGVVGKSRGLERLCEKYSIPISESIFVGDDINDFKAMNIAGRKIYYCADKREFKNEELPIGITLIPNNDLMDVADAILYDSIDEIL